MSFYKEVPGRKTTLESTLKFDTTPTAGSTNPVTSDGIATAITEAVGGASDALQEQIDDIAEKAGSGYTPKGPASVATLNGLTGQENGWLYTMTDAGTLTDGSVAVVAGDTVAWDATNSVWYKAMDYATRNGLSGVPEFLIGGITLEQGGFLYGVKVDNSARVRFSSPLIPPFHIKVKGSYQILSVHKLDSNGDYIDYETIYGSTLTISASDNYKYCVVIKRNDDQDLTPSEDIIAEFKYGTAQLSENIQEDVDEKISSFTYEEFDPSASYTAGEHCSYNGEIYVFQQPKNAGSWDSSLVVLDSLPNITKNSGIIERMNGGVVLEQGGFRGGVKIDNPRRVRFSVHLIPPFKITTKAGYQVYSVHILDNFGKYIDYVVVGGESYSVSINDGKKYAIIFAKYDSSQNISPSEDIIQNFEYSTFSDLAIKNELKTQIHSVKIFERVGVIGDSYAAGYIKNDSQTRIIAPNSSWPCFMEGLTSRKWSNYAKSGSTCKSWVLKADNFSNLDLMESDGEKCQAYVIGLQINDVDPNNYYATPTAGVITDIGTDNDTYCAYLYKLIQAVISINPDSKIFVCTCPKLSNAAGSHNDILRQVVEYCYTTLNQGVYCIDLYNNKQYFNSNPAFVGDAINGHYTGIGYEYMAEVLDVLISNLINSKISDFQNVARIPFDAVT